MKFQWRFRKYNSYSYIENRTVQLDNGHKGINCIFLPNSLRTLCLLLLKKRKKNDEPISQFEITKEVQVEYDNTMTNNSRNSD